MKNKLKYFGFLLLLLSSVSQAKLSCTELEDIAASLDELAEGLAQVESIGIDSDLDVALDELVDALDIIAEYEDDARFDAKVDQLDTAWEDANRDSFESALDDIIARLDSLAERDCG